MNAADKLAAVMDDAEGAVAELNARYAICVVGGRTAVLVEADHRIEFWTKGAFFDFLAGQEVLDGDKMVPLARHWWNHPEARRYSRVVFAPDEAAAGVYNLWRGFSVEPVAGQCGKFLDHVHSNVCCGDDDLYNWVIGWFAHIVQHPGQKIGTSLVLRGEPGVGKTFLGETIGSMFPRHYLPVDHPALVAGRFNSHLASLLLLHADEAFFAGDRTAAGRLRTLVTSPELVIEFKGREPVKVKNCCRLLVTSEHNWLVPASLGERRFAVLDVSPARKNDQRYFLAIADELKASGRAALLRYLLDFDLSSVPLRTIPQTEGLLDQKLASMRADTAFWMECLRRGAVLATSAEWEDRVQCDRLYEKYLEFAQNCGARYRLTPEQLGKSLRRMCPGVERVRLRDGTGGRSYYYVLPDLDKARQALDKHIGARAAWTP